MLKKDEFYSEYWTKDCKFSIKVTKHIHQEQTKFQLIDVYDSITFGKFLTLDGLMMVNEKDEFIYHDMISHIPLAVNPNIKKVLIIGGGDGGTAREISRYKHIEVIDMIEIDERVVRISQQYLNITANKLDNDKRINLLFEDGLLYVKNKESNYYDLILVDSTDPIGPGEGLFSTEFYKNCYRILNNDGILINQHESPYFETNKYEMKKAHKKIKNTFEIAKVYQFNMPTYPSGHWLFGFASKKYDPIKDHKPDIWESFNIKTKYYNSDLHKASFYLPTYVKEELDNE